MNPKVLKVITKGRDVTVTVDYKLYRDDDFDETIKEDSFEITIPAIRVLELSLKWRLSKEGWMEQLLKIVEPSADAMVKVLIGNGCIGYNIKFKSLSGPAIPFDDYQDDKVFFSKY